MDELDYACLRATRARRAAYKAWRRASSPEAYAAYEEAFHAWERAIARRAARQEAWRKEQLWSPWARLKGHEKE